MPFRYEQQEPGRGSSTGGERVSNKPKIRRTKKTKENHIVMAVKLSNESEQQVFDKEFQKTIRKLNRLLEDGLSYSVTYL